MIKLNSKNVEKTIKCRNVGGGVLDDLVPKACLNTNNQQHTTNNTGITLIALVLTIVVMLILAGVAISATIGENGIITNTQKASFANKIAKYKEELAINILMNIGENGVENKNQVTALKQGMKTYIPSIKEIDYDTFGIIRGELYYIGDDMIQKEMAEKLGLNIKPDNIGVDDYISIFQAKALESIVKELGGKGFVNVNDKDDKGTPLYDKILANSNKWKIITEVDNKRNVVATYGTNWYFLEKGTELERIGVLQNDYIINYDERKMVQFNPNIHAMLQYGSDLAVKDSMIFNIDPSIIEAANSGDTSWNTGLDTYGYEANYNDAFSEYGLKFDGINDYLRIKGNMGKVLNQGFTYEFYGVPSAVGCGLVDVTDTKPNEETGEIPLYHNQQNGSAYRYLKTELEENGRLYQYYVNTKTGILGLGVNDLTAKNYIKFLFRNDALYETPEPNQIMNIYFNYGQGFYNRLPQYDENNNPVLDEAGNQVYKAEAVNVLDENDTPVLNGQGKPIVTYDTLNKWSTYLYAGDGADYWNQCANLGLYNIKMYYGQEIYYSIVINPLTQKQELYINGELIDSVQFNTNGWKGLKEETKKIVEEGEQGYWYVGRATENSEKHWNTFQGEMYSMRVYERPLSADEIKANYNATISYHNMMVDGNKGSTGGETGGSDMGQAASNP